MAAAVHVLVFEGFEESAPARALAEARRGATVDVVSVGLDDWPVTAACGMRVLPDRELADVAPEDVRLLLLPHGDVWEQERYPRAPLERLLERLAAAGVPVVAVGAAAVALARAGLLADRAHTSDAREYLAWLVPEFGGAQRYVDAPVVHDRGVVTARSDVTAELAAAVAEALGVSAGRPVAARRAAGGSWLPVGHGVWQGGGAARGSAPAEARRCWPPWRGRVDV